MSQVSGWGSRIELVSRKGRISFTGLRAMEDADDDTIETYREQLERRFNDYGDHAHDFFSFSSPLIVEEDSMLESDWTDEATMACGEDCEVSGMRVYRLFFYRRGVLCRILDANLSPLLVRTRNVKYPMSIN